ncbi:MAG TPA: phosphate-starvation-inducible PsiE family protein [Mycobacteriales bacterium]|nr:phosphate-starvation-inducible PsiE family protein [Mycobacteriales bacterium]
MTAKRAPTPPEPQQPERVAAFNRAMTLIEDVVYAAIALVLSAGAVGLLFVAGRDLVEAWGDEDTQGLVHVLDTLLLVFIFVELLYAVRLTVRERQVLVEPFLLVAVLAAIKEIVVLSVEAAEQVHEDAQAFSRSLSEMGVLTVLVVALALSAYLLRRKEREPAERD